MIIGLVLFSVFDMLNCLCALAWFNYSPTECSSYAATCPDIHFLSEHNGFLHCVVDDADDDSDDDDINGGDEYGGGCDQDVERWCYITAANYEQFERVY